MNEIISVLPESVANQIAAGEVIQRPASVLKELVENAIDAGARNIAIEVEDAGRSLLRVTDNGSGMSPMDARMAFERHATSKIHLASDLFTLHSMGFRGEALASIASVAQVELTTRRQTDDVATKLVLDGSEVVEAFEVAAPVGSSFTVRNLFFNVPARRRFLKTDRTEMGHLMDQFERIALVYPDIHFTLQSDGVVISSLPASSLKQRISDTLGKSIDKGLIPLSFNNEFAKIDGFIGSPETAKRRAAQQFFFVNGRYMKHPYFNKAVATVFEKLLPPSYRPNYFIYFTVDPSRIDVNIHPTKTEIKFLDERTIFRVLVMVIRQALSHAASLPSLHFEAVNIVDIPAYNINETVSNDYDPDAIDDPNYNPFIDPSGKSSFPSSSYTSFSNSSSFAEASLPRPKSDWQQSFDSFTNERFTAQLPSQPPTQPLFTSDELSDSIQQTPSTSNTILLFDGNFILTPLSGGLAVIDVQRAQQRFMFDTFMHELSQTKTEAMPQRLLIPQVLNLSPSDALFFDELIPNFESVGFEISPLGADAFSILSVPLDIEAEASEILLEVIQKIKETDGTPEEELATAIAISFLNRKARSIPPVTTLQQAEELIAQLFSLTDNYLTPSGRPIFRILQPTEIRNLIG